MQVQLAFVKCTHAYQSAPSLLNALLQSTFQFNAHRSNRHWLRGRRCSCTWRVAAAASALGRCACCASCYLRQVPVHCPHH